MATIANNSNFRDEKDKENQPQQLGGPQSSTITPTTAASGTGAGTPSSGRFTNINKYMGANQQAGSQLGQALGQNVQSQIQKVSDVASKAQTGLQSQIGETGQEQQRIQDYTTGLSSTAGKKETTEGQPLSTVTGKGYLAEHFDANLGDRSKYAQDIVSDPSKLDEFLKYASGQVASQQKSKLDESKTSAQTATEKAQQEFVDKQKQLQNNRQQLLSDLIKRPGYSLGQRSLDNAFLQMDKGDTLNKTRQNIQQQQRQFETENLFPKLSEQYTTARSGIDEATKGLTTQTQQNLSDLDADIASRQAYMNAARKAEQDYLQKQFEALQKGQAVDADFAQRAGLTSGQSLWKTLSGVDNINSLIDTTALQAMANSQQDLANTRDIELMSAFAKLAQTDPSLVTASTLGADGGQTKAFADAVKAANQKYQDDTKSYTLNSSYKLPLGMTDSTRTINGIDVSNLMDSLKSYGFTDAQLQNTATLQKDPKFQQYLKTKGLQAAYSAKPLEQVYDEMETARAYRDRYGFGMMSDPRIQQLYEKDWYANQDKLMRDDYSTAISNVLKNLASQGYFNQVKIK